tara:strand:- start:309 stop:416 length:108 start_codon:yes stop_codon:yes gene_type:complete
MNFLSTTQIASVQKGYIVNRYKARASQRRIHQVFG